MKKVLILFGEKNWNANVFEDDTYRYSYETLYSYFKEHAIEMYRASYTWYDKKNSRFSHAWTFTEGSWIRCSDITPDAIFDKTTSENKHTSIVRKIAATTPFINPLHFSILLDNKRLLPLLFPKSTKKQINILNKNDIDKITSLSGERVVVKPADSSRGKDVSVMDKKEAHAFIMQQENPYTWIVQEFVDSKNGIPNVMKGVHDLRIVMVNKKISYTYYREPAKNSLIANLALGGTKKIIPIHELPNTITKIIDDANTLFSMFNNSCYSIDCMFDENEIPWIIELNSAPGMFFEPKDLQIAKSVYADLVDLFKAL